MNYIFLIGTIAIIAAILAIAAFSNFQLDDEHYDRVKWIVRHWAYIVTFVGLLAKTFNLPYGVETVTVVAGIGALLAGLMDISTLNYHTNGVQTKFNNDSLEDMVEVKDGKENDTTI